MAKKGTQHYTDVTRSTGLQSRNRELYYRPTTSSIEWKRERERKKEREKTRGRLDGLLNKKKKRAIEIFLFIRTASNNNNVVNFIVVQFFSYCHFDASVSLCNFCETIP